MSRYGRLEDTPKAFSAALTLPNAKFEYLKNPRTPKLLRALIRIPFFQSSGRGPNQRPMP